MLALYSSVKYKVKLSLTGTKLLELQSQVHAWKGFYVNPLFSGKLSFIPHQLCEQQTIQLSSLPFDFFAPYKF